MGGVGCTALAAGSMTPAEYGLVVMGGWRAGVGRLTPYEIGVALFFTMNSPSPIDVTTTMPDLKNG